MDTQLQQNLDLSKTFSESAMLVSFTWRQWGATKEDKKLTKEIADSHQFEGPGGRYFKILIRSSILKTYENLGAYARDWHYRHTLAWGDTNQRLLPTKMYFDYVKQMGEYAKQGAALADEFVAKYDNELALAKRRLKDAFNEGDYPTKDSLRRKFACELNYWPLPSDNTNDFRIQIGQKQLNKMAAQIQSHYKRVYEESMRDLWNQLYERINHMHEQLTGQKKRVHHTLVNNTEEWLDVLSKLNVTDDPQYNKMIAEARLKLCKYTTEKIKGDDPTRTQVSNDAKDILERMRVYVGTTA